MLPLPQLQEEFLPTPPELRQIVQNFMLLTAGPGSGTVVRTLLPTFQVLLLINLGSGAQLWPAGSPDVAQVCQVNGIVLTGPVKTALQYRLQPGGRVLAVAFTLQGFFRLFRVPVEELGPGLTDPDDLVGHGGFARLWERLVRLPHPGQLVQEVADFFGPFLRAAETPQVQLLAQLPLLSASPHLSPLKVMAPASNVSERSMQLRFRKYLGFSAKEAVRFLRFRRVMNALQQLGPAGSTADWVALLEQHGYYDQSHLIHDFTHFLHQPPVEVARKLLRGDAICFARTDLE